ncbi:MAG TPA: hypothetical protein VLA43_16660 [Longimicrobiales bacterium]|nr:hypothetical protein [Longimicrobiales bacterium]
MYRSYCQRSLTGLGLAAALLLAGCDSPAATGPLGDAAGDPLPTALARSDAAPASGDAMFRVYNRNVFLGGDTGPLFTLFAPPNEPTIEDLIAAATVFWGEVKASRTMERAGAIADEIARRRPQVVTLQEVASYWIVEAGPETPPHVVDGDDMLYALQAAMADRGLDYQLVERPLTFDGGFPLGPPFGVGPQGNPLFTKVMAVQAGEATFVRGDVELVGHDSDHYAAALPLGPLTLHRNWTRVSVQHQGVPHHVLNTHLEIQSIVIPGPDVQMNLVQGMELMAVADGLEGVTIVTGDLNSDAEAGPGAPSWTPTYGMFKNAGWVDAWEQAVGSHGIGYTCCWDPDLASGMLDERIDFFLVRAPDAAGPRGGDRPFAGAVQMSILGDEADEMVPGYGLFPGDHAGIYLALNLPRGRMMGY